MQIEKAIVALRNKLGLSQREFAQQLGVTVTTISRYENGRQPNRELLEPLARIAEVAKSTHLRDVFQKQWKSEITAKVKRLPSAGTQRRVSVSDLKYWSAYLNETMEAITCVRSQDPTVLLGHLDNARFVMAHVRENIELYIDEAYSSTRLRQDEAILRLRRALNRAPKR